MLKLYCVFAALLLIRVPSHAQDQSLLVLKGVVLDDSTGEGLSFATISYHPNGVNTLSNDRGEFIFKIRHGAAGDSIQISHVGYKAVTLSTRQKNSDNLAIRLHRKPIQLSDVVVNAVDPLNIIRKAMDRIPDNYPNSPYLLDGFYRLTTKYDNRIIGLSEAVFQIFGRDYSTKSQQFSLIKARVDKDWNAFGYGITKIRRPEGIIAVDLVGRIHTAPVLGDTEMPALEFAYLGIIDYEGREAYEIGFDQKSDVRKAYHRGTIIIDKETLAFLSVTRTLSPRGIQYWKIKSKADRAALYDAQMTDTMYNDSVVVTYRPYGGKYYLRHYYRYTSGRLSGGRDSIRIDLNPYFTETNYLVTRIDTDGVRPFADSTLINRRTPIERHASYVRSSDKFWENYNLIEASFNVDSVTNDLRRRNLNRLNRP